MAINIRRNPPTLGAARKELGFDDMREIGKFADFFAHMCRTHPEIVRNEYMGSFAKVLCEEVEAGERKGMNFVQQMEWYAENAEMLADRIAGPKG